MKSHHTAATHQRLADTSAMDHAACFYQGSVQFHSYEISNKNMGKQRYLDICHSR